MSDMFNKTGLRTPHRCVKRSFDFVGAFFGLVLTWWIILIAWMIASIDTKSNGLFMQQRVGKNGRIFWVFKIRTMIFFPDCTTNVTIDGDPRITRIGRFFRKTKIDELPQLVNVLIGHMSFVGPRPDVPSYADTLSGDDRIILSVRPGITGPATIKYKFEETLLTEHEDAEAYNRDVIWPDKVRINKQYIRDWSFRKDLCYIIKTILEKVEC